MSAGEGITDRGLAKAMVMLKNLEKEKAREKELNKKYLVEARQASQEWVNDESERRNLKTERTKFLEQECEAATTNQGWNLMTVMRNAQEKLKVDDERLAYQEFCRKVFVASSQNDAQ